MTLIELSVEYRESGEKCRRYLERLKYTLEHEPMSETERLVLRRRIYMVEEMARQTIATSNFLKNYYAGTGKINVRS